MKDFLIIAVIIILFIVISILSQIKKSENENDINEIIPYRRKYLLTKNEFYFYKSLKEIAEKHNLCIITKVRLADLVEVNNEVKDKEKLKYFSKIKSKHIDFVLCNKENLFPELLIELQDNSHNKQDRIKRDEFIKKVAEKTNYKIIFVYGINDLEKQIEEKLTPDNAIKNQE